MKRPSGFVGWAAAIAVAFLGLAAAMCVAIIPTEILFDPDAELSGVLMTSGMVALLNVVLAFVVINTVGSRAALMVVAVVAAGLSLFTLTGALSLAAGHPHAAAFVPIPFWAACAADAIAAVATVVAAIAVPKTSSATRTPAH